MKKTNCIPPYRRETLQAQPSAWIVDPKDKGRKKIYPGNKIYFEDGSEFMIELFNPLQDSVLAELKINNKSASSTGLILRPGERFYLDCFIDERKKFIFKTYEVEVGSEVVQKAIANNGNIEIYFYREKIKPKPIPQPQPMWKASTRSYSGGGYSRPGISALEYDSSNINYGDYLAENLDKSIAYSEYVAQGTTTNIDYTAYLDLNTGYSNMSNTAGLGNICAPMGGKNLMSKYKANNKWNPVVSGAQGPQGLCGPQGIQGSQGIASSPVLEETGRIEKGQTSEQQFVAIDMDFEYYAMTTVIYQMLPESKKPLTTKEVKADAKNYCPNCGCKITQGDRFCRNCGHRL